MAETASMNVSEQRKYLHKTRIRYNARRKSPTQPKRDQVLFILLQNIIPKVKPRGLRLITEN